MVRGLHELDVGHLVPDHEEGGAAVARHEDPRQGRSNHPWISKHRIHVSVARHDALERALVEAVEVLDVLGDVLAAQITDDQLGRERVAQADEVRARRVERIGERRGLANQRPAVLRADLLDVVREVLDAQEVLDVVQAVLD